MEDINQKLVCKKNTSGTVQIYLDLGADVNWKDPDGNTALHVACHAPLLSPDIITTLLNHGCKPDEKNKKGKTALHVAVTCHNVNPKIITTFIEHGFNPDAKDKMGNTVLHSACLERLLNLDIITTLLNNGCKLDEKNEKGQTALHVAVSYSNGNPNIISTLIEKGFNPDERDNMGRTALHTAADQYRVNPNIFATLTKNSLKPDERDREGRTALHIAVGRNEVNLDIITTLLKIGLNPDEKDKEGRTALHIAVNRHMLNSDIITTLIKYGVNPDTKDGEGRTALHLACFPLEHPFNCQTTITTLIRNGCRTDEKDNKGRTVLHVAISQHHRDENAIRFLLENGCKPNDKDKEGRTALHIAASIPSVNKNVIQALLEYGCFPKVKDGKGRTALHVAVEQDNVDRNIVKILLENGCKDEMDLMGRTALHIVVNRDDRDLHFVTTLLESGCIPNGKDIKGNTPYMILKERVRQQGKEKREATMKILKDYENCWQWGLPLEVKDLDNKSANLFVSLLEEEGYHHYEARVMLAGEQGLGKTTVARYLVGRGPTYISKSTDGIDLYNGLSFIDRDTDEWLHGKQGFTLSDIAISRSLRQEKDTSASHKLNTKHLMEVEEEQSGDESFNIITDDTLPNKSDKMQNKYSNYNNDVDQPITHIGMVTENTALEPSSVFSNETTEKNSKRENIRIAPFKVLCQPTQDRLGDPSDLKKDKVECPNADTNIKSSKSSKNTEVVQNHGIIEKLKKLFGVKKEVTEIKVSMTKTRIWEESLKVGKKKLHQKKIAPVIIWDFGGQDVFYSTHQTFLTYRAIYLILLDGSRNLDDPCPFEQYLPGKSGPKTARDYLKFWINTIVTYCKGSGPGFPKIMIVLTHKDKVKAVEVESRRQKIFHDIEDMFSGSPLISHLVIKDRIFVNATNKRDPEMTKIKRNITEQAMKQPTWGQKLPKCFIPLELEFDILLKRNIFLITMEHMETINNVHPVRSLTKNELQVFLKFQHAVGRILYFDEANLNQHIILAPTHLIDAFKSIVTDRRFCTGDRLRQESWDLMSQKGVIEKKSIEEIWKKNKYKKFQEHKEYLLGVMTHIDILVEPKRYDKSHKRIPAEFYYVASMVRTKNTTGYLESPNFTQRNIAIAFSSSSSMIPPALSFRFVSYCLSLLAIKQYGQNNNMLFHRSAVFTIDPSLDMCVSCDDDIIVVRLVHSTNRALIMRDLASSIRECLADALEKINQLYVKTSSTGTITDKASFNLRLCCSSPVDPCFLSMFKLQEQDGSWICPKHGIEHTKDVLSSWALQKEDIQCGVACPATDTDFLRQFPTDIHLRRLSMQYSVNETKELAIYLGMQYNTWERLYETFREEPERLNFETLRRCLDGSDITFYNIRQAIENGKIQNLHNICKVVRGQPIDFDQEPEKWDIVPSEEHFDKLAPLVGNNSLAFLVELGMDFTTWEQIRFKQNDRDLVKLNLLILQEWKTFCNLKIIRPSLRLIGQAFNNIGKNIKIVENALADFF